MSPTKANYALKSTDAVRAKLRRAILYMERNPKLIRLPFAGLPAHPSTASLPDSCTAK